MTASDNKVKSSITNMYSLNSQIGIIKKNSVGTVRIIATEGLDSLHTDKTTPHARPLYITELYIWQA